MSKPKVPISWISRLILNNKAISLESSHHNPMSIASSMIPRHNQNRHVYINPEDSKDKQHEMGAVDKFFGVSGERICLNCHTQDFPILESIAVTSDGSFKGMYKPAEFQVSQEAKYTATFAGGSHNGLFGFGKAAGLGVPFALHKAYDKCFEKRPIHNLAGGLKQLDKFNAKDTEKFQGLYSYSSQRNSSTSTNLRPLSPHLPIYQPQMNSTLSILNRISGVVLTSVVLSFYFLYMKTGLICLTNESFYQCLFYSSKLNLLALEISAVAMTYHVFSGVRHLLKDFSVTK